MMIIDGEGAVFGRLSSRVAKLLLKGEEVTIVNADKTVITGNPKFVRDRYLEKLALGNPIHGPFFPRRADLMLKRAVKGMLPHQKAKGMAALRRLRVYKDRPESVKGDAEQMKREIRSRSITLGELANSLNV